jgi:hypothetical protein
MRKTLFLTLLLCGMAAAQPLPKNGQAFQTVIYDINGDGRKDTITLNAYNIQQEAEAYFGRLKVADAEGRVLWEGPKVKDAGDAFAFGSWPYGSSSIEWLGDIDGDKKNDLLAPQPVSDVRPPTYRRYRWVNDAFVAQPPKMLLESPAGSGVFVWSDPVDWDGVSALTWVSKVSGAPSIIVDVTAAKKGGGAEYWSGQAKLTPGKSLKVSSWIKPLAPLNN